MNVSHSEHRSVISGLARADDFDIELENSRVDRWYAQYGGSRRAETSTQGGPGDEITGTAETSGI